VVREDLLELNVPVQFSGHCKDLVDALGEQRKTQSSTETDLTCSNEAVAPYVTPSNNALEKETSVAILYSNKDTVQTEEGKGGKRTVGTAVCNPQVGGNGGEDVRRKGSEHWDAVASF
jgi:hypothetical protein